MCELGISWSDMMYLSLVDLVSDKATKVCELQSELTNPIVEQEDSEGEVNKLLQFQLQNEQGVNLGLQERVEERIDP